MGVIYLIILIVNFLIVPTLYYVFKSEREVNKGKRRAAVILLVVLYVVFALIPSQDGLSAYYQFGFIAFPLLYAVLLRKHFRRLFSPPLRTWLVFIIVFLLLMLAELILAVDLVRNGDYNGNFSIFLHFIGYSGFYFGIVLTIVFFYRKWNFSLWQVFTIGGVWGLIVEQGFAGPIMLLSGNFFYFIVFASFIFPTYGLILTAPRLLFSEEFRRPKKSKWQSVLLLIAIILVPLIVWGIFSLLFAVLGMDIGGVI